MKSKLSLLLAAMYFCGYAQESPNLKQLKTEGSAVVTVKKSTSTPSFMRFQNPKGLALTGKQAKDKAAEFLKKNYKAFNLQSAEDMVYASERVDKNGLKTVIYKQFYKGIPVYDGGLKFHFNQNTDLTAINGFPIQNIKLSPNPVISAAQAAQIAKEKVEEQGKTTFSDAALQTFGSELLVFPKGVAQGFVATPYLTYKVEVTNKANVREFVFIDAYTGDLVEQFTGIHTDLDRKLYEKNTNASSLKWKEGDAFPGALDIWQQSEVKTSEHVYNMFKNVFGHISYDGADASMITINNDPKISCPNANWNGTTANYCTGTASDDVVAHEWGHAYTSYTSGLIYQYQSGALNESFSDVWGETVDLINSYFDENENLAVRTTQNCNESKRWKMGEKTTAFGGPLRDMWNPNCNQNPGRVNDAYYYCGSGDQGGVHLNSGVPNHLYALLVDGGTFNGKTINGIGLVKASHLWWRAQSAYLNMMSDFVDFADALEASCLDLVGVNLNGLTVGANPAVPSGETFTAADLENIQNAIAAVELRADVVELCGYTKILKDTPPLCEAATGNPLFTENWENGIGSWTVSNQPVNPSSWEQRNWKVVDALPQGRTGKAAFGADPINGDCQASMQNGIISLESPVITFPTYTGGKYELAFNHYVATEAKYDGGNLKYSLDGGTWKIVPQTAFTQNPHNLVLANQDNDNPLKNQRAFSGTNQGTFKGSWGQSVVDLGALGVVSGSTIKFKFDMGTDGCNGVDGWYVDEIYVYNCAALAVEDLQKGSSIKVFPNPTTGLVNIQNVKGLKNAEIYNTNGQLIKRFDLKGTDANANVDLSSFTSGVYVLKVNTNTDSNTVKVIKK